MPQTGDELARRHDAAACHVDGHDGTARSSRGRVQRLVRHRAFSPTPIVARMHRGIAMGMHTRMAALDGALRSGEPRRAGKRRISIDVG
ncbi:hypothetical protein COL27_28795, partial [Bacillus sp. AFS075960]